jgi:predicted RNase H-like HicB family nuclease
MASRYYPALITRDEGDAGGFGVVFPDLPGCVSGGDSVTDAAESAAEALALHLEGMVEEGLPLPDPSAPGEVPVWLEDIPGRIVTTVLVPADAPGRAVRANITMDASLLRRVDAAAAADGDTRSGFLAQAARERLRGRQAG